MLDKEYALSVFGFDLKQKIVLIYILLERTNAFVPFLANISSINAYSRVFGQVMISFFLSLFPLAFHHPIQTLMLLCIQAMSSHERISPLFYFGQGRFRVSLIS